MTDPSTTVPLKPLPASIDDGGPAFPTTPVHHGYSPDTHGMGTGASTGLSLRDYFAGHALTGLLSGQYSDGCRYNCTTLPKEAYTIADAMLAARNGGAQ